MSISPEKNKVPCVLFPYSRPEKFVQVVSALRTQEVDHIIVFVDGPKNKQAVGPVEECKRIAGTIDWTGVDCIFKKKNEGPQAFIDNIDLVLQSYDSMIILEEDCLPMPSFYSVIKQALRHYRDDKRVFSIGGYQQLPDGFFQSYPYSFVSSLRYMCWGSALWRDRWELITPYLKNGVDGLRGFASIPDVVGDDLASFARYVSMGGKQRWDTLSWDTKIAVLALYFNKVHLLTTRGLVKNIGMESGIHGVEDRAIHTIYNRNLYYRKELDITWLDGTMPNAEYNSKLKASVDTVRSYFSEKSASGTLVRPPVTFAELVAKLPHIIEQMGADPLLTTKKIAARVFGGRIRPLAEIRKTRSIRDYSKYLTTTGKTKAKRALLSYLVPPPAYPRVNRDRRMVDNPGIAQYIPRALNELGYRVDIINYDDTRFKVRKDYDLFIGHAGINFESIFRRLSPDSVKIYFSTRTYWQSWNDRERERFEDLQKRRGIFLPYDKYIHDSEEFANRNADGIICLGSEYVRETYARFPLVISINNAAFPDSRYDYGRKDFEEGRKNFLFYGGPGNVQNGLDLLLDVFQRTDSHIYICTAIEPLFEKAFSNEIHGYPNIHLIRNVHLSDPMIYPILNRCNFTILPSCSQGQPGCVIECMHRGLIPIVSRETNIDTGDFGITLDDCSTDEILRVVREVSQEPVERHRERSGKTRTVCRRQYTAQRFLDSMKDAIGFIVNQAREIQREADGHI